MMTKVTTKTKKAFLILAAVERGLFKNNMEASKVSNENLYKMIKEWDTQHEQEQGSERAETKPEAKTEKSAVADGEKDGKKRRLPKRNSKMENFDGNGKAIPKKPVENAEQPAVEVIEYKDIRTFRYLMLNLIREKYDVNYAKVQLAKIPKKHYSYAIELLNESISNAMTVLGKVPEAEIVIHLVDKDGNVHDGSVLVSRAKLAECKAHLEEVDKENEKYRTFAKDKGFKETKSSKTFTDESALSEENVKGNQVVGEQKSEPKTEEEIKADEDKKTADMIIASFNALKIELDQAHKDNNELKVKVRKLESKIDSKVKREVAIHDELVNFMNKIANTKDEKYVWIWKELNTFVSTKLTRVEKSPIVLDIEKLIIEESIRMREEADAQRILEEKKAKALEEDTMYEGEHISYIDGEVVKPDGVKKKVFNAYKVWTDDCEEWVDYVIEQSDEINKQKIIPKRKKAINALKSELDGWYDEWAEACDADEIDMVTNIMIELVDSKVKNRDKAMSNLVAIVDGLEL